ncbi:MAG: hypothetical protein ACLGGV_08965 [Bacteroidia bacterium]
MAPNSFGNWYKKNYTKSHLDTPNNVWENISVRLDAEMPQKRRFAGFYYSVGILMLIGIATLFMKNQYTELYSPIVNGDKNIATNENVDNDFSFLYPAKSKKKSVEKNIFNNAKVNVKTTISVDKNALLSSNNYFSSKRFENIFLPKKSPTLINFIIPEFNFFNASNNLTIAEESVTQKETRHLPIWAGVGYHFNQSTLINNIFKQGLDENSLVLLQNFQSKNFSALVGYDVNEKISVVAQAYIASSIGQKYATYTEGVFTTNILQFDRSSVSISLRTPLNSTEKMIPLFASAGIYGAKISSVEINKNETKYSLSDNYRKFDTGIALGISTEIPLIKGISIMPQIETKIGAVNLFKGENKIPSHFNKTNTLSLKAGASLKISL